MAGDAGESRASLRAQLGDEVMRLRAEVAARERELRQREEEFGRYISQLREAVRRERAQAEQVGRSYVAAVRALTNAVEARDAYTGRHAERVAAYGLALLRVVDSDLARRPDLEFGFLLHDVGKVGVPDAILHKPAGLSAGEMKIMRRHPLIGFDIVSHIDFLHGEARQVVRSHHERWDGGGYPDRIAGPEIPLPARVFSVADTLDAITTDRPYRAGASLGEARERIAAEAGRQFDPLAVEALGEIPDGALEEIRAL